MAGQERAILDVRVLGRSRETIAYTDGGLFPVLALAPGGVIVGIVRGGAGHLGLAGRVEVVRSLDGGGTWSQPAVVADSEWDDRDYACGVSPAGTLILAYHRSGCYDADGNYRPERYQESGEPVSEVRVTRSHDAGLTWETPVPLSFPALRPNNPFGKIVALADGTLVMPIYGPAHPDLLGARYHDLSANTYCSYLLRSHDDGATWDEPSVIASGTNETGLIALPGGDLLAAVRGDSPSTNLSLTRSADGGRSWSEPVPLTTTGQHPADFVALANGDLLLTYGNRNPPYRVEGRISRDGGQTWLDLLLTFSGHLYGYNVTEPRPTDLGDPSSVVLPGGRGVTLYYYTPSLRQSGTDRFKLSSSFYSANDYRNIAVTWREDELLAALAQLG
jgi:hypothetical protein